MLVVSSIFAEPLQSIFRYHDVGLTSASSVFSLSSLLYLPNLDSVHLIRYLLYAEY